MMSGSSPVVAVRSVADVVVFIVVVRLNRQE